MKSILTLRGRIYGGVVALLGLITVVATFSFPSMPEGHPGPGLFPLIIGGILLLVGVFLFFERANVEEAQDDHSMEGQWIKILLLLVVLGVFPLIYQAGGFMLALVVTILAVALLLGIAIIRSIIIAGLSTVAIYLLFSQLLHVPL